MYQRILSAGLIFGLSAFGLAACNGTASINAQSNSGGQQSGGSGASVDLNASGSRVINGIEVSYDISPQMVMIDQTLTNGGRGICSGVAITPEFVLTAAHCFSAEVASSSLVINGVSTPITEVITHPGYYASAEVSALFNDIALVKSSLPLTATLPVHMSSPLEAGIEVSLYGFGLDENGNFGKLKSGLDKVAIVTDNHIFSEPFDGSNVNACLGDSGGPAILGFNDINGNFNVGIVGIVSSGTLPACEKGDSTLFVNLQNKAIIDFLLTYAPGVVFN